MSYRTPCKLIGVGVIWNVTDNVELGNQSEMGFNFPINALDIPAGESFSSHRIATLQRLTGRFGFKDMSSAEIAAHIVGNATIGSTVKLISKEEVTSNATFDVTLAEQPHLFSETLAPIKVVDAAGNVYKQVASASATGEFDDAGAKKLQFHTDLADGTTLYVTYFWADAASGVTVAMDPDALPTHKRYVFAGRLYDTGTRSWKGYLVAEIAKLLRIGEIGYAPGVGDAATPGFDWEATVENTSDAKFYFEQE